MTRYGRARPSQRDAKIVGGLSAAVIAAPIALSAAAVVFSGTNGSGERRPSLLVSEAVAAPAPGEMRGFAANPAAPDLVITAPARSLRLGEASILPPAFRARAGAAPAAQVAAAPAAPAPASRLRQAAMRAQLRLLSQGAPMPAARALDGLRIESDGLVVRLAGVEDAPADAQCRRLDGVMESCRARAASRLAVLIQGREVVCRISALESDSEAIGRCTAGKIDLAEDLARQGLALRAGATQAAAAADRAI